MNQVRRLLEFLRHGIWGLDLRAQPRWRRLGLNLMKVALHVAIRFSRSLTGLQAAGLTLLSLLALVPMAALAFTVAGVLGYRADLDAQMQQFANGLSIEMQQVVDRLRQMVLGTNLSALGLLGTLLVIWTGLTLFTRTEQAVNQIFRSRRGRGWLRRIADFVAMLTVVPPLALGALVATSMLGGMTRAGLREHVPMVAQLYELGLGFLPHVMMSIACMLLYRLLPNARVRWLPALAGGLLAGTAIVVVHGLYVSFQIGVANANAIYATLAALPLLIVYLQVIWTIVLVGAEVTYAVQNCDSLRGEEEPPPLSPSVRRRLAWHLVQRAGAGFRQGQRGVRTSQLGMDLDVPGEWLDAIVDDLLHAGILVQVQGDDDLVMPGRPPEQIEPARVLAAAEGLTGGFLDRVRLEAAPEQALAQAERGAGVALQPFGF